MWVVPYMYMYYYGDSFLLVLIGGVQYLQLSCHLFEEIGTFTVYLKIKRRAVKKKLMNQVRFFLLFS